jgi:hypothetical protein
MLKFRTFTNGISIDIFVSQIVNVCHCSMGGLVVKQLLVQASQDEKRHDEKRARLSKKTSGIVSSSPFMFFR